MADEGRVSLLTKAAESASEAGPIMVAQWCERETAPNPFFIGDAKYKNPSRGYDPSDIYQVLTYCTAAGLPSGLLVYAAVKSKPKAYKIRNSEKTIEVAFLNLEGTPESILDQVGGLAEKIKDSALDVQMETAS